MAANTTAFFVSAERLVICELEGLIFKLTFRKGFTESFGISVMVANDAGFHTPRIRPLSPRTPDNASCENVNHSIHLFTISINSIKQENIFIFIVDKVKFILTYSSKQKFCFLFKKML